MSKITVSTILHNLSLSFSLSLSPFIFSAMPLPSECTSVETIALNQTTSTTVVLKSCDLTSPVQPSNLNYTWSKNGAPLDLNETRFTVNQFGLLTIENITWGDLGVYRVRISNAFGCALHTIKLAASPALPSTAQFQRFRGKFNLATIT